ncbi:hypothetical protein [Pseudooceanicola sp. LIPI14-2-Ac024]|uniref:hypothetical protein n=1 Tax=Pseudooceanicola sp. LIPI14-2-Ac024 TaxID=3344875 RepID=UPI0035D09832
MRTMISRARRGAVAAGLSVALVGPALAGDVTLKLALVGPYGPDQLKDFAVVVLPEEMLVVPVDTLKFDSFNSNWVVPVAGPGRSHRSDLSIRLESADENVPLRPIYVALGLFANDTVVPVSIPYIGPTDAAEAQVLLKTAYEDGIGGFSQDKLIRTYLTAVHEIERLVALEDTRGFPMKRTMVVFADAMNELVRTTDWFGVPKADLNRYRAIIDTLSVGSANAEPLSASTKRVLNAARLFSEAEGTLYGRHWQALRQMPEYECEQVYTAAGSLYDDLRGLEEARYKQVKDTAQFTRTQVLLLRSQCFRQLLHIEPAVRSVDDYVAEEVFDERPLIEVAGALRTDLTREGLTIRGTGPQATDRDPCARPSTITELRPVCEAIAYLDEAMPMLKDP